MIGFLDVSLAFDMKISNIIEALIFSSEGPIRPAEILDLWQDESFAGLELNEVDLQEVLLQLKEKYLDDAFVFELRQIDGGYQFYTKKLYYPFARHSAIVKNKKKLSKASLETLSIIAYRQPITKTEVEFVRGVSCDYAVRKLLDQKLVEILGRSDAPGRPLLYGTTSFFMEYFSLNNLRDLPKLEEVSVDEGLFQKQFKVYLKENDPDEAQVEPSPDLFSSAEEE